MGQGDITLLVVLLVTGCVSGFETKLCEHEDTVETVKSTFSCAVEVVIGLLRDYQTNYAGIDVLMVPIICKLK